MAQLACNRIFYVLAHKKTKCKWLGNFRRYSELVTNISKMKVIRGYKFNLGEFKIYLNMQI